MISKFIKRSYKLAMATFAVSAVLVVLVVVGANTFINSKNMGVAGKNSSSKIAKNEVTKDVKNKEKNLKDVNAKNAAVKNSEVSNKADEIKNNSIKVVSKSNDVASHNKLKQCYYDSTNNNIEAKVKDFILKGQQDIPEAGRIKWSEAFLNQVDIQGLYKKYISNGGKAGDVKSFAEYITINAPIQSNWQELFKKDLYNNYQEKVVKIVYLGGDLYQSYIINDDGSEVPSVAVSARTGWFHG